MINYYEMCHVFLLVFEKWLSGKGDYFILGYDSQDEKR